jgi:hypothetical protein
MIKIAIKSEEADSGMEEMEKPLTKKPASGRIQDRNSFP